MYLKYGNKQKECPHDIKNNYKRHKFYQYIIFKLKPKKKKKTMGSKHFI